MLSMISSEAFSAPPARMWAALSGLSCNEMANSPMETRNIIGMRVRSLLRMTVPMPMPSAPLRHGRTRGRGTTPVRNSMITIIS